MKTGAFTSGVSSSVEDETLAVVRSTLSVQLTHEMSTTRARALDIEEVSLILANAIRHELSPTVVRQSVSLLSQHMQAAVRRPHGMFSTASTTSLQKGEALIRVMEACVALAEVHPQRVHYFTLEAWAQLVSWTEEHWDGFEASPSTAALRVHFFSVANGCVLRVREDGERQAAQPVECQSVAASLSRSLGSLGTLRTDPTLLLERCYTLSVRAFEVFVGSLATDDGTEEGTGSSTRNVCSTAELVRCCWTARRLQRFEMQSRAVLGAPHKRQQRWWPSLSSGGSVVATASVTGPRVPAESMSTTHRLHRELRLLVAKQAVRRLRQSRHPAAPAASATHCLGTLVQTAVIFTAVCDDASPHLTATISHHLCGVLRSQGHQAMSSAEGVDCVLGAGEACIRQPEGTLTTLAEVFRLLQLASSFLLPVGGAGSPFSHQWPRACELIERAPLPVRGAADKTLHVFLKELNMVGPLARFVPKPSPPRDVPLPSVQANAVPFCHLRHGSVLLACQLMARPNGYLHPGLEHRVRGLVTAYPFSCEELPVVVRALSLFTQLAVRASTADDPTDNAVPGHMRTISLLLTELSALLSLPETSSAGDTARLQSLTVRERAGLRESLRTLRFQLLNAKGRDCPGGGAMTGPERAARRAEAAPGMAGREYSPATLPVHGGGSTRCRPPDVEGLGAEVRLLSAEIGGLAAA